MLAKINYRALQIAIEKPLERACRQKAIELAEEKFEDAKKKLLEDFLDNPISKEIEEGPESEGGILTAEGNLFGFLGFQVGDTPIDNLYHFLNDNITMKQTPTYDGARKEYLFPVYSPSKEEIKAETPLEWGTAASWVYSIETGIGSLLNHFLAAREKAKGRSTAGIEVKGIVTPSVQFRGRSYLTDMLEEFKQEIKSI